MLTDELDFELPKELIATRPAEPRDSARLLVVSRSDPARIEHRRMSDLPEYLRADDILALNRTRVLPARFRGVNRDTGGRVQGLWLGDAPNDALARDTNEPDAVMWRAMIKSRRHRPGFVIDLIGAHGETTGIAIELVDRASDEEAGAWLVRVHADPHTDGQAGTRADTAQLLSRAGMTPLPPYILAARKAGEIEIDDDLDRALYQTVFAAGDGQTLDTGAPVAGSVAAPTAGLHFTPDLLRRIDAMGVDRAEVVLQVGAGTFKPIETDVVEDHPMHAEWCSVPPKARGLIFGAPRRRVVAVGSTSARTIESHALALERGESPPDWMETDILISPGYRWRRVDVLMTNFHLPRSTLIAMVASLFPGGVGALKAVYEEAIGEGYRFFSYGDGMLVVE